MKTPLVIGSNGQVAAIDTGSGQELWRTELQRGFFNSTTHQDVSVLVHGEFVLAGCHGHLFCLSLGTGDILWHNELQGLGYNDVSLAMEGVSVQYLQKVVRSSSGTSSS